MNLLDRMDGDTTVERALSYLSERINDAPVVSSWDALLAYLTLKTATERVEVFRVLFLDRKNRLIEDREMGRGTVDHCPAYVREIARAALDLDASAVILTHNHPSGDPAPSQADIIVTQRVVAALALFEIVTHDHVITGGTKTHSMKSNGELDA